MEFHKTAYLGPLIDAAVLPVQHSHHQNEYDVPKIPMVGKTPEQAKKAGEDVSGRILSVTTSFSHVGTMSLTGEVSLRDRKGLSSLTAMLDYIEEDTEWEQIKIAWLGEIEGAEDRELTREQRLELETQLGPKNRPVWLGGNAKKWREFAEQVLWPTLHYSNSGKDSDAEKGVTESTEGWKYYLKLNQHFADVVLTEYRPGDVIMIHDMYLMLLPSLLRKQLPNALIGLYVPSPFPSSELFKMLPQRVQLLQGMLGSTIIGFQSKQYIKHFVSASTRLTGIEAADNKLLYNGRYVACVAVPFGLNVKYVLERSKAPEVSQISQEIKDMYRNKLLVVGRDKLDSTQGLTQKLKAFLALLELYPQWRGKVVFVQITTATWQYSPWLEEEMSQLISYINSKFGDLNYTPIIHFSRRLEQDEYFGLLKTADVGFFTPIREGASSAAIEYVLCKYGRSQELFQQFGKDKSSPIGASMVLSEFMGITDLMSQGGNPVNPYDSLQVAFVLNQALQVSQAAGLSENDVKIYETARDHYDVGHFVVEFLSHLVLHDLKHENQHCTPEANAKEISAVYKQAKKRLVLLDYDGTLTPIVRDPAAAVPSERLKRILKTLTEDVNTTVWVISGRDMAFLDQHLSHYKINLSAEHGCYVKYAEQGPDAQWEDLAAQVDMNWMKVVLDVLQSYTERTEGSVIEKKKSAITWHYRKSDPVFGAFQASHLRAYLELTVSKNYPVEVMAGKANVEIRPKLFNKGEIVRNIFKTAHKNNEFPEFVLCSGDDTTDEDMFRVLSDETTQKGLFSILVGPQSKLTLAKYHVSNVDKIHDVLEGLKP